MPPASPWDRCQYCGAEMLWCLTSRGRFIPVDPSSLSGEDRELLERFARIPYRYGRHVTHFDSCRYRGGQRSRGRWRREREADELHVERVVGGG